MQDWICAHAAAHERQKPNPDISKLVTIIVRDQGSRLVDAFKKARVDILTASAASCHSICPLGEVVVITQVHAMGAHTPYLRAEMRIIGLVCEIFCKTESVYTKALEALG